jgi:hypothetical protein
MIISLQHNYIYIRTRKTGSTTIEWLLRQHLGPEDIVVQSSLECLKPILRPGAEIPDAEELKQHHEHRQSAVITHVAASEVIPLIREDIWNGALKFTSERHPYEKAVSLAYYRMDRIKRAGRTEKFEELARKFTRHLNRTVKGGQYATFRYYSVDDKPVVDDVIKLESIKEDLRRIGERIGFAVPDELPRRRGKSRTDKRAAREILTPEQRDIVYEHCRPEFEFLGYER